MFITAAFKASLGDWGRGEYSVRHGNRLGASARPPRLTYSCTASVGSRSRGAVCGDGRHRGTASVLTVCSVTHHDDAPRTSCHVQSVHATMRDEHAHIRALAHTHARTHWHATYDTKGWIDSRVSRRRTLPEQADSCMPPCLFPSHTHTCSPRDTYCFWITRQSYAAC